MAEVGTVRWFNESKGFGFIGRNGDRDVFLHVSDVRKAGLLGQLHEGQSIEYDLEDTPKGPKAINLKLNGS